MMNKFLFREISALLLKNSAPLIIRHLYHIMENSFHFLAKVITSIIESRNYAPLAHKPPPPYGNVMIPRISPLPTFAQS